MKGDFSRDSFDEGKHYSSVLMQQGRVSLDSDWNEESAISRHYLRAMAADLIGPHGGPAHKCGFAVTGGPAEDRESQRDQQARLALQPGDFLIGAGHYYVDGILCENTEPRLHTRQPDFTAAPLEPGTYLVYLDVWERHITAIEDPGIREPALGGADTASRLKVVWQVKTHTVEDGDDCTSIRRQWRELQASWQPPNRGRLRATLAPSEGGSTPGGYQGFESSLYRVEIHADGVGGAASFKWSRENGSVARAVLNIILDTATGSTVVSLDELGQPGESVWDVGDWTELADDDYVLHGRHQPLLRVVDFDQDKQQVTVDGIPTAGLGQDPAKHPLLRRWHHKGADADGGGLALQDGAVLISEGEGSGDWMNLESGLRVQFKPGATYRTGDYWLIPARVDAGIIWPESATGPCWLPPFGVEHHYAPLAVVNVDGEGMVTAGDCRCCFRPLCLHGRPR